MGLGCLLGIKRQLLRRGGNSTEDEGLQEETSQRAGMLLTFGRALTCPLSPSPTLLASCVDTLEMINEVEPPASRAGAGTEPSPKQPVAEGLLTALQPFLSESLVSQVGACYQFNVLLPSGTQSIYFLDLTTGVSVLSAFPVPFHSGCLCPSPMVY